MNRNRTGFGRLALGIVVVGIALAYLVYQATSENLTYYRTVEEVLASPDALSGQIRISGDVVLQSIVRNDEAREIRFAIQSTTPEISGEPPTAPRQVEVVYRGTVPDIFREGIQVVIEGRFDEGRTFEAETLLAKCPSKYQAAGDLTSTTPPAAR